MCVIKKIKIKLKKLFTNSWKYVIIYLESGGLKLCY